jgi:signal transduction histidine kinase
MHIDKAFLTSKVARRIFLLFVFCAIVPLFVLAGVTFKSVNHQLAEQAMMKLRQNCKIKGLEIYNNLSLVDMELRVMSARMKESSPQGPVFRPSESRQAPGRPFRALALVTDKGQKVNLIGDVGELPSFTDEQQHQLGIGRALLLILGDSKAGPRIIMARLVQPDRPELGMVLADIEPSYLWGTEEDSLPSDVQTLVLEPTGHLLYASTPHLMFSSEILARAARSPGSGSFSLEQQGEELIAAYWSLFLKYHFLTSHWTIMMSQPKSSVLEPVAHFKTLFSLMILLTFLIVCLLSGVLIRKNLVPMEILRKGTERIANGEFGASVNIQSGDEFENLGKAFNHMSQKLREGRAMLVQSAKMGAVGQMAAGIVHEIGQPLTSISGLMELSLMEKTPEALQKRLQMMKGEMERLTGIISRFKNFARLTEGKMTPVSLNEVVDSIHGLLQHQLQMKRITFSINKAEALPKITGDKNSLQQVLINLIINAADALEEKRREKPSIQVKTFLSDSIVYVSVQDNGPGIPKEIQDHIFEPFFTTKKGGKGTGLGLAIIDSILHQHKAKIALETEAGKGTKFTISFPPSSSQKAVL